jgi:hypothetical protein
MNTKLIRKAAALMAFGLLGTLNTNAQRAVFVEETVSQDEFRMENLAIPSWDIVPAGPGKDGIPAITDPEMASAKHDRWLDPKEAVIGVTINGKAKAYPVRILNYHEVVNDDFGGEAVAITYSPLCGSGMAYLTENRDQSWELAVSGLLYNNNPLLYDRQTESLWCQATGEAVSGPLSGAELELLPTTYTTWGEWQERHPNTLVMTTETGFQRNYEIDAYAYYAGTDRLMFPLNESDNRLPIKERVLGVEVDGAFKAYPFALLPTENGITEDEFNGQHIRIEFDKVAQAAYVTDADGNPLPSASMYWFAWSSFHPDTQIHGLLPEGYRTTLSMAFGMP